jgi:hypothetical protein
MKLKGDSSMIVTIKTQDNRLVSGEPLHKTVCGTQAIVQEGEFIRFGIIIQPEAQDASKTKNRSRNHRVTRSR